MICDRFPRSEENTGEGAVERTVLSARDLTDDTVTLRAERPALLLSSTSWTGERKSLNAHERPAHILFII